MPPLKETRLQIQERNRREIRQRTNKRLAELAQETESERQGSSKTVQEDEIEDKMEDKMEDKTEDKTEDKMEEKSGLFVSRLLRVCLCGVFVVFLVILSMFVWSVVFHLCLKTP
jgi:Flp pilus assembly protein TadB